MKEVTPMAERQNSYRSAVFTKFVGRTNLSHTTTFHAQPLRLKSGKCTFPNPKQNVSPGCARVHGFCMIEEHRD